MTQTAALELTDQGPTAALSGFFRKILEHSEIAGLLAPHRLAQTDMILPVLITDPEQVAGVTPVSPAFAVNTARMVSRLTRQPAGGTIAAVLRPCEIRAFVELVKLNQGRTEDLILIGIDCPGAMQNAEYFDFYQTHQDGTEEAFFASAFPKDGQPGDFPGMAPACRACIQPTPEGADLAIGLFGLQPGPAIQVYAQTPRGETLLNALDLAEAESEASRQQTVEQVISRRSRAREEMTARTRSATDSLEKLTAYVSRCINCYNCRNACPVCYCRECVFATDVFDHEPALYLKWAHRKGSVKMPVDTVFYHLTRMAHISTACVGCGQCANVCPSGIPLAELFISAAEKTQAAFDYHPGRNPDEAPPLAVFYEKEFEEVVGISDET